MRTKKELSITGDQNGLVSNRKSNSWFTRMLSSSCVALTVIMSQSALADQKQLVGDDFKLIQTSIDMQEKSVLLPVPKYKFVDIAGKYKNAPDSKACGGNVSEGDTLDSDACLLRPELTFTDGYLDTNGTVITPNAAVYNGQIGNFEVRGNVGDIVEMTVNNKLPEAEGGVAKSTGFYAPANNLQTVHWHGMELDNESDGSTVAESGIEPGKSRVYRFRLYRPGPFWFHPHVLPLLTESRGMVGRLIVRSDADDTLEQIDVLPKNYTAVTLTDMTVANETNRTAYTTTGGGQIFNHFSDQEVDNHLLPNISPDLNGDGKCDRGVQAHDCIVREGELVVVNGTVPTSDKDIETINVREGGGARIAFINSSNERFYRFRLLLAGEKPPSGPAQQAGKPKTGECYATGSTEQFTGADPLSCDQGLPLYRVGGEGGLLDNVRLEGQPELAPGEGPRAYDTIIRRGEDFIGPSERTEFVVVTKDRDGHYLKAGESMYIWTIDFPHGAYAAKFGDDIGNGDVRNRDISARKLVRIKIVPNTGNLPPFHIAEGDPLMVHSAVNRPTENIKLLATNQLSAVPTGLDLNGNPFAGITDPAIKLDNHVAADGTRYPSINNVRGEYSGTGGKIGNALPTQGTTRYARVGDVVEFVYANDTANAHHPFHMHGFSFQPIAIYNFHAVDTDNDGIGDKAVLDDPVYVYDYNEFIDVIAMQPGKAVKFRMKMNDRFKIPDAAKFNEQQLKLQFPYDKSKPYGGPGDMANLTSAEMGGAVGRWLYHCHILHHAGLGMIGDLCVAPKGDPDASGCKIHIDENITF